MYILGHPTSSNITPHTHRLIYTYTQYNIQTIEGKPALTYSTKTFGTQLQIKGLELLLANRTRTINFHQYFPTTVLYVWVKIWQMWFGMYYNRKFNDFFMTTWKEVVKKRK
jgi:hypothetical protein